MTVKELREKLKELPEDMEVEILDNDGNDSRYLGDVCTEQVTRGWALPTPHVYKVVVLSSGSEGL
jgi:hypothetical protein